MKHRTNHLNKKAFILSMIDGEHAGGDMVALFLRFREEQSGATAIEYCIMAAGISLAIFATVFSIGPKLSPTFATISAALK
jgi:pilus assembly protein Flp/PilA